jgi:hypothetical protein
LRGLEGPCSHAPAVCTPSSPKAAWYSRVTVTRRAIQHYANMVVPAAPITCTENGD